LNPTLRDRPDLLPGEAWMCDSDASRLDQLLRLRERLS